MGVKITFFVAALSIASGLLAQDTDTKQIPRTPDGRPDLSGMYDTATLTPLERPVELGDNLLLTPEEAESIRAKEAARTKRLALPSDVDREAPPLGGDGSPGAAGNVGGYNNFWIDRGTEAFSLDGKVRTSIIVEPPNGRIPEMTPAGTKRRAAWSSLFGKNTGEAWWLDRPGPGPYDNPERRPLGERCLLAFGSSSGPPSLPVLYNNFKRIVQTQDYVVILVEMVHDARIIPLNREHAPKEIRKWMGDSVGHWEGDTLVVDTTNFTDKTAFRGASENLHVVERFTRVDENTVLYQFTIDDPDTWETPWSGEYPWIATEDAMYEYACHEANYALGNILRGARLLEAEAEEKKR